MTETNQTEPIGTGAIQDVTHLGLAVGRVTELRNNGCPGCRVLWDELRYEIQTGQAVLESYYDLIKRHGKLAEKYAAKCEQLREALALRGAQ